MTSASSPLQNAERSSGLSSSVEKHLKTYFAAHEQLAPSSGLYDLVLQEVERPLLQIVMKECQGNQLRAAAILGLNRNTLRKKLRQLGLSVQRGRRLSRGQV